MPKVLHVTSCVRGHHGEGPSSEMPFLKAFQKQYWFGTSTLCTGWPKLWSTFEHHLCVLVTRSPPTRYQSLVSVQTQKQLSKEHYLLSVIGPNILLTMSSYIPVQSMPFIRALMIRQCSSAITMHDWVCPNQVTWMHRLPTSLSMLQALKAVKIWLKDVDDPVRQLSADVRSKLWHQPPVDQNTETHM